MTTRRNPPAGFPQRVTVAIEAMIPGTVGGRVRNASPIPAGDESDARASGLGDAAALDLGNGIEFYRDRFTLRAVGAQNITLTYLPVLYSEHVYLNGIELDEGTDWTRNDQTISLLAAADAFTDDVVDVRYAYLTGAPVTVTDITVVSIPDSGSGSSTGDIPSDALTTDFAVVIASERSTGSAGSLTVEVKDAGGSWRSLTLRAGSGTTHIISSLYTFAPRAGDQQVRISDPTSGVTISGVLLLIPDIGAIVDADSASARSTDTQLGGATCSLNPSTYVAGDITMFCALEEATTNPGVNPCGGATSVTDQVWAGSAGYSNWALGFSLTGSTATATNGDVGSDSLFAFARVLPG